MKINFKFNQKKLGLKLYQIKFVYNKKYIYLLKTPRKCHENI